MATIIQLKITLRDSKPPIWRRIQVRSDTSLAKLHLIFQATMGWTDSHLHQFTVDGVYFGEPHPDYGFEVIDERRVKLPQIVEQPKDKFIYEYDFGDGWEHIVVVEKILDSEPNVHYPRCIKGKRNCPPEDIGGVWGYEAFLEAMANPSHPEHRMYKEWFGGSFDPEAFDLATVNQWLKELG